MIDIKKFLSEENFQFDYGWRKQICLDICGKSYNVEIVISSFYEEDEITLKQIKLYENVTQVPDILNNEQDIILFNISKEYGVINKKLIDILDIKQIIISDDINIDFGIYCESNIDSENGIGIKIKDKKVIEIGPGDIVI